MYYSILRICVKFFTISPQVSCPDITQPGFVMMDDLNKILSRTYMPDGRPRKSFCVTSDDEVNIGELSAGAHETVFEVRFVRCEGTQTLFRANRPYNQQIRKPLDCFSSCRFIKPFLHNIVNIL